MEEKRVFIELPEFTGRNGLQKGVLKFGFALKKDNSSEFNYYCPDKKVWEETGYFKVEM